jgi:cysteinyl-tRNA synthetase
MPLKLYNTLTRKKETFKPIIKGKVGLYTCGPTVYWFPTIGNMRAYVFSDILKRTLLYNNYKVKHIMNVTDVGHLTSDSDEGEDKIELAAEKENRSAKEIASFYLNIFKKDTKKLNILPPTKYTKATDHIKEQISLISKLESKKLTYKTTDGIYFNSKKFKNYGRLARLNIRNLKAGSRIAQGEKKNKTDFALWKFSPFDSNRQQEWDSPWGIGFPGWHIECSAMSMKYLGSHFDIHTGGEDHISVHHTNEIAQSEGATGKKFVNFWLHGAFLQFRGSKVSKSKGGLYTVQELQKIGYKPLEFRYLLLQTHYRKPLNFSLENLDASKNAISHLSRKIKELRTNIHKGNDLTNKYEPLFKKALDDDLNTPKALQVLNAVLDDFDFDPKKKLTLLENMDSILGLNIKDMKESSLSIPKEVKKLIEARERLRKNKFWNEADVIRHRIKDLGFQIEDKPNGPKVDKI